MTEYTKIIYLMGTKISLYIKGEETEMLAEKAEEMLIRYNEIFSANSDHSQLAMIKKMAGIAPKKVDEELYELIKTGKKHSLNENSFLNIAIGPLIKLWRIGFTEAQVPDKESIEKVLELLNPENIQLDDDNKTVYLQKKEWRSTWEPLPKVISQIRSWSFLKIMARFQLWWIWAGMCWCMETPPPMAVTGTWESRTRFCQEEMRLR